MIETLSEQRDRSNQHEACEREDSGMMRRLIVDTLKFLPVVGLFLALWWVL